MIFSFLSNYIDVKIILIHFFSKKELQKTYKKK